MAEKPIICILGEAPIVKSLNIFPIKTGPYPIKNPIIANLIGPKNFLRFFLGASDLVNQRINWIPIKIIKLVLMGLNPFKIFNLIPKNLSLTPPTMMTINPMMKLIEMTKCTN